MTIPTLNHNSTMITALPSCVLKACLIITSVINVKLVHMYTYLLLHQNVYIFKGKHCCKYVVLLHCWVFVNCL